MTNYAGASMEDQIKKLLQENLEYSKEIYEINQKVKRYIFWGRIISLVQLLLVIVPIILGIIYLPSLASDFIHNFTGLNAVKGEVPSVDGGSLNILLDQYKELLNYNK
ncbi:MAG: hypothetical protein AUJ28_02485 [Parcubacteria group bacterium CG1_02_37_51]|uniref:Uncharacterized protein n=2 Tax=Candidatus Komeiliibacteriota TaxID=1817908 RepID=A0A2M8DQ88_9BACT|nr:MAG: hypothetical protein AUJ28_02485 [Parcubacteria group bacterium CG1_02_37_51]PIY94242.1 MAG: hypothetical protein COY67_02810 [Candidatus Komeilibacteria bacterium CG_4_10_14_0_8_um_filter_37_78]PJC01205.1 MAG: hypothetical protein CO073_04035 [Candidatus Komeilibacteria bacterium CG_4_9_14_0_8_um_filter_36_9]